MSQHQDAGMVEVQEVVFSLASKPFNIMAHWIRHIMPICVYPLEVEWMNIHWIAPLNIEKYEGGGFIHLGGSISNRRQSSRRRWHPAYRGDLGQVTIVMDPHYALFFGDLQNSPIISTNMPMASSPRNAVSKPLMTIRIPPRAVGCTPSL